MARTLYLDKKFSTTVNKLYDEKDPVTSERLFPNLVDVMVFAAMVGRDTFDDCKGRKVGTDGREVPSRFFSTAGTGSKDGIAYLLALDYKNDGNILREENDKEMWDYMENYSSLGLEQIHSWLEGKGNLNIDVKDILLEKMKEVAIRDGLHKSEEGS